MTRPLSGKRGHAPAPCCDLGSRITAQIISSLIETRPPLPDLVLTNCRRPWGRRSPAGVDIARVVAV